MRRPVALFALALAGCAAPPAPSGESVVPGSIGAVVGRADAGVLVTALRADNRSAGLRVTDSRPGSVARLHVLRDGGQRVVDVPVEQLDLAPRT